MSEQEKLVEIINDFFGCDAAYYDINPLDLAIHLLTNGVRLEENQATSDESNRLTAVEVVHGHWFCLEPEIGLFECSECGHKILRASCNYCPNCGAKMDGGVFNGSAESD